MNNVIKPQSTQAAEASRKRGRTLSSMLLAEHARLDQLFADLLNRVHAGDVAVIQPMWTQFERGLLDHMAAEEQQILPLFEADNPAEARAIRAEHQSFRETLARMGVDLELHLTQEATVEELVRALQAHAAREDAVLYRWADRSLPAENASLLARMFDAAVSAAGGSLFAL